MCNKEGVRAVADCRSRTSCIIDTCIHMSSYPSVTEEGIDKERTRKVN